MVEERLEVDICVFCWRVREMRSNIKARAFIDLFLFIYYE